MDRVAKGEAVRVTQRVPVRTRPRAGLRAVFWAALVLAASARAQAPFSFDSTFGRLPKNVVPLHYAIAITPDVASSTIRGSESVLLDFRQATDTIVFNTLNEKLEHVLLDDEPASSVNAEDGSQRTTVMLSRPAPVGPHTLTFSYSGRIETRPQGLFAQPYTKSGGGEAQLISTQFEATDARRMFPCWDEPAFRATFELTATVPADWSAVSNMPVARRVVDGKLATITFQRTPKMPTYLLEFSAGDLVAITAQQGATRLSVWTVRGEEKNGATALANARAILGDYNEYFGTAYPLAKLDSIALPGGFSGAMENWGAITYNDQNLLVWPSSTVADRQNVFSIQAHEMAHQWYGDLVTMGWWDDIWLNESFASWMSAKETDLRNPDWNWWEAEDADKEAAMQADARASSHPIQIHVTDELQAESSFDEEITYNKGQAVLRMLEGYLGPDVFRDGIRRYMKAHAYSNATTVDLWNALSAASGRDVGHIAASWTSAAGFPLVSVESHCDGEGRRTIALSQKRFLLRGADAVPSHWNVPLRIRSGVDGVPQPVLLTQDGQSLEIGKCGDTLTVNAGSIGFYRVRYDEATLQTDTRQFSALPRADRISLLDDQWALVEAGSEPLASYLALASALGPRLEERAWAQITSALGTIEYAERARPEHDAFAQYARSVLAPLAAKLGWTSKLDETPGIRNLRRTVLKDLGSCGDEQILAEARQRFATFGKDRSTIAPDDQEAVLSIVAEHADDATFERLHALARSAADQTELRRYYTVLMHVRDPQLAAKAAHIVMSAEIPLQATSERLWLVMELAHEHPLLAWTTFTNNVDALIAPFPGFANLILSQSCPKALWDAAPPEELEAWIRAHVPAEMSDNVARGMETARFKLEEKKALAQAADDYFAAQPPRVPRSASDQIVAQRVHTAF